MSTVHANGCDFNYRLEGKGQDMIFIHGEIHGCEYFEHQFKEFSKDFRCFTYDRRGHFNTSWTDYGFSLVNQTRDLEALIATLGLNRPILVSVAFGTTIASNYAINNPGNVKGVVLAAWSEMHDAASYLKVWAAASARVTEVLERDGRDALIELLRREGGKTVYRVIPVDSHIREDVVQLMGRHPLEEYKRGMLEFGSSVPNLVPAFSRLTVPALGICGVKDPYPDQPELLNGMKSFTEVPMVSGAGRFVHWEQPETFNSAVRAFVQKLG